MKPSISTHVLDLAHGVPARGIRVELYRGGSLVSAHETNDDGRVADMVGDTLMAGTYRLVFHVASAFFTRFETEFSVTDPARHYHIPLLLSPFGCTTYRGS
jgi:5-hydroxyisourate hydrolase